MAAAEQITKHYLISGRVQGVGFRAFTERSAHELKLTGWVRNLEDGRVEAVARGMPSALNEFALRLKSAPAHGHVESLVITDLMADDVHVTANCDFTSFSTRKDRA